MKENPSARTKLTYEQWQALIHLHKTLLHEHHDFFLASQHPSPGTAASTSLAEYNMPARMWRHGIHYFLLASQHPTESTAMIILAAKYKMPARMWRHGIHYFLECP